MRVAMSAYLWHEGRDYRAAGVSTYIDQLMRHLVASRSGHEYVVFTGRDAPRIDGIEYAVSPVPTRVPWTRIAWEQVALPVQVGHRKLDLLHATVNVAPVVHRVPTVVTVHDLAFLRHPERFARSKASYLRHAVAFSARRATRVIAVSESTRADVLDLLDVPADRVSVVHLGVDSRFQMLPAETRGHYPATIPGRPFILYVGTLEPRKNLDVLIAAFARARQGLGLPHALVLVGAPGWQYDSLYQQVRELGLESDVMFVGYVPPTELPLWYNDADLFVYPSAYEGFGLPLLEAMSCGVPCITSRTSALQELAGNACLTVQPGSQEDLSVAITRVLADGDLRRRLRELALVRAAEYRWSRTASNTIAVYEQAVGSAA